METLGKEKIYLTHAFDLLVKLMTYPCTISKEVARIETHATVDGYRSVVAFNGQQYEVLVNPLYKYADEFNQ